MIETNIDHNKHVCKGEYSHMASSQIGEFGERELVNVENIKIMKRLFYLKQVYQEYLLLNAIALTVSYFQYATKIQGTIVGVCELINKQWVLPHKNTFSFIRKQ